MATRLRHLNEDRISHLNFNPKQLAAFKMSMKFFCLIIRNN